MDTHHIEAGPDPAHVAMDNHRATSVALMGASGRAAVAVTDSQQQGAKDQATLVQRKRFATLQAVLALTGFELNPTPAGVYIVMRWNMARNLATLDDVRSFAQQVGAPL